jgi:peptidoglycan/xylan/chitin deacetylase (PgdA/CDA1 family)
MRRLIRHSAAALLVSGRLWPIVPRGRAVVLRYHRVGGTPDEPVPLGVSPEEFDAQLRFLRRRCSVMPPGELVDAVIAGKPFPPNAVAITFDDGYEDNATAALPLLRRHGLTAAFFLTAGWVGTDRVMWWDRLHEVVRHATREGAGGIERLRELDVSGRLPAEGTDLSRLGSAELERALVESLRHGSGEPRAIEDRVGELAQQIGLPEGVGGCCGPMTWDQARELHQAGMEIGSHTMSHARLAKLPPDRVRAELAESKAAIEEHLGDAIGLLAYPAGSHSPEVAAAASEAGYRAAFTTEAGSVAAGAEPFALPRVGVWGGGYRGAFAAFSPSVFGLQVGRLARR